MNTTTKSLLAVLILLAAGFGIYQLLSGDGGSPYDSPQPVENDEQERPDRPVDQVQVDRTRPDKPPQNGGVTRTEVDDQPASGEQYEQGVTGLVVDPRGAPVAGVQAFLFEGAGANIFEMMLKQQRGMIDPPLASTETDDSGRFRLGLREIPQGKVFELRFASDRFPDKSMPSLHLFSGKWWDAGRVQLDQGVVVEGSVRAEASGAPVEGAIVNVQPAGQALQFGAMPGRENGVETVTDSNGRYRVVNAPVGVANVSAAAEGFARVTVQNKQLSAEAPTTVDFVLPPGKSIAGVVTDADGNPIQSAAIQAFAISSKNPLTLRTRSDGRGRFSIIGLVDGPYQLDVNASGYIARQVKPVLAGETEEIIVLEKQGGARVRAIAKSGRRIDAFEVDVRRYFPDQPTHGFLHGRPTERVRSGDLVDGWYEVASLDPGQYVFEVRARGYAKAFSEPFEIANGQPDPEREVPLSSGGKIVGRIVTTDGSALAGAQVTTLPDFYEDNAVTQMFGGLVPYQVTQTGANTKADGRFELPTLTPGTYQLKIHHPQAVTTYQKGIEVVDDQTTDVGELRLEPGVEVFGTARVDGTPAAQVRITVSAAVDPNVPPEERTVGFSAQTVTDDEGNFRLPRRLPPGTYQATAARQGNPFLMVVDHNKTRQEFSVGSGMTEYQVHFQLQSQ